MQAAAGHAGSRDSSKVFRSPGLPRPNRVTHRDFIAPVPGLPPWQHGAARTAGDSKVSGTRGHVMRCVIRIAKSISPLSWIHQRHRESLSLAAQRRVFSDRFGRTAAFRPGEIPTSARANCNPITGHWLAPCTSERCHPFNAHRPDIFRRFSPIRL